MTRRVLFVDDERHVLDGLRDRMRRRRDQWEMTFVDSGDAAMTVLGQQPIDVVVTDLRMPGMDGASLLQRVQEQFPRVVRIVLSGQADAEMALRAANVAHQFLAKPSEPGAIEQVVERAVLLQALVSNDRLRDVVGRISHLPAAPRVYGELQAALSCDGVTSGKVAAILERDPAIAAKTLQLVNSAFFRLSRPIVEIEQAVVYLGLDTIRQVTLAVEVFQQRRQGNAAPNADLDGLRTHALTVGHVAARLVGESRAQRDAFIAGLFHDIGKLVLASELPEHLAEAQREAARLGCACHEAERALAGVTHAEVGAYLLGLWGLPTAVIEAVAYHHAPWDAGASELGPLVATYVADFLVNDHLAAVEGHTSPERLHREFLATIGVDDRLAEWRDAVARELAATTAETRRSAHA